MMSMKLKSSRGLGLSDGRHDDEVDGDVDVDE